jgi:hypothetical protein
VAQPQEIVFLVTQPSEQRFLFLPFFGDEHLFFFLVAAAEVELAGNASQNKVIGRIFQSVLCCLQG